MLGRCWADAGADPGHILGRPWTDAGQSLLTLARIWGSVGGDRFRRRGECTEVGQVLGRCWPDHVHILGGLSTDAEEILGSSWGQVLGQILARS